MSRHERALHAVPPENCRDCPLRGLGLFTPPESSELDKVQGIRRGTRRLNHAEIIHNEGDRVTHAFTIFQGYAVRYRLLPSGHRQVLQFLLKGDLIYHFGDAAETRWPDTTEAVDHAVLCALCSNDLQRLFDEDITFAHRIADIRAAEQRLLEEHLTDIGQRSAFEGILHLLLELFLGAQQRGLSETRGCFFPFRQHDIGDALGLSNVHVNRILSELREDGLVALKDRWLDIPDIARITDRLAIPRAEVKVEPGVRPLL